MARVIMIGNQKGGVGKTMISHELCALFVRRGNKVLGIDVDGQRDFSRYSDISFAKKIPTIRDLLLKIKDIKTQSALGDEKKEDSDFEDFEDESDDDVYKGDIIKDISSEFKLERNQIYRVLSFRKLKPELLDMLDRKLMPMYAGYTLASVSMEKQAILYDFIKENYIEKISKKMWMPL